MWWTIGAIVLFVVFMKSQDASEPQYPKNGQ